MSESVKQKLSIVVVIFLVSFTGFLIYRDFQTKNSTFEGTHIDLMDESEKSVRFQEAIEIVNPSGFINTDSITIRENIGKKVMLIDFWTYSCINCQRTTPYLNSWYEKYKDKGFEIIGIHTPEFEFEKDIKNVQGAVFDFKIKYPVVLDNDYSTWSAYKNRFWPRKYLIDIDGYIVYDHIGEGNYKETEMKIQELLEERNRVLGENLDINEEISTPDGAELVNLGVKRSPETYFGALRNTNFGSGMSGMVSMQTFKEPSEVKLNTLYLVGDWNIAEEFTENKSSEAKIIFKYQAQKVFIVASADEEVTARILIDGQSAGSISGADVDGGFLKVKEDKLYRIIEANDHEEHVLEIIIEEPGFRAFAFTFG